MTTGSSERGQGQALGAAIVWPSVMAKVGCLYGIYACIRADVPLVVLSDLVRTQEHSRGTAFVRAGPRSEIVFRPTEARSICRRRHFLTERTYTGCCVHCHLRGTLSWSERRYSRACGDAPL